MECYVAYLLDEDEDGPHELSIDMFPEDGHIRVGEDGVTPFTEDAPLRNRKFADSPLEGNGFELVVPRHESRGFPEHPQVPGLDRVTLRDRKFAPRESA